jgi:hypothetical protein
MIETGKDKALPKLGILLDTSQIGKYIYHLDDEQSINLSNSN